MASTAPAVALRAGRQNPGGAKPPKPLRHCQRSDLALVGRVSRHHSTVSGSRSIEGSHPNRATCSALDPPDTRTVDMPLPLYRARPSGW